MALWNDSKPGLLLKVTISDLDLIKDLSFTKAVHNGHLEAIWHGQLQYCGHTNESWSKNYKMDSKAIEDLLQQDSLVPTAASVFSAMSLLMLTSGCIRMCFWTG